MQVRVFYFGLMRHYVSDGQEALEMPEGSTVGDLVESLTTKHGAEFYEHLINEHGDGSLEILPNAFITLDGRSIANLQGLDTVLTSDADTHIVLVGPVVTGG